MLINRRVLLVDDAPAIHEDFRKILAPDKSAHQDLDATEALIFGAAPRPTASFELASAFQGQQALEMVENALQEQRPYALAFIDMRMPPGWDGVETIARLWERDPDLQVVICTAYSDYTWEDVLERLDVRDRLLVLKKPFDNIEVLQMANTLAAKWEMARQVAWQMGELESEVRKGVARISHVEQALERGAQEREQLEGQLLHAEKLAAVGQLAAGVAHEINSPMGYVSSNLTALEDYLGRLMAYLEATERMADGDLGDRLRILRDELEIDVLREELPQVVQESREGVMRVRQIVRDMKDLSRIDAGQEWCWADLHPGIESTLNILSSQLKYKVEVVRDFATLPSIQCLPSQINQVIMNLVVNAVQALGEEGGRLTLRTRTEDGRVSLEVEDTGCGISVESLPRIFDPFFTTKPPESGTGLGLTLSYGIVKKHGGSLSVQSEPGKGTTFRMELPVLAGA